MPILLTPPVALVFLGVVIYGLFGLFGRLTNGAQANGSAMSSYACGEEDQSLQSRPFTDGRNPEYRAFFGSALFFTVSEVCVLLLITLPLQGRVPREALALLFAVLLCSAGLLGELRSYRR